MLSVIFCGGDMILGSPPCAHLGSVTILKTMTGHHSVLLHVLSQQTDKVLRAPPDLSAAELVELVSVLSKTWQSPKLIPKYSLFCKVTVQFLSTLASEGCDEMCSYGGHVCVNSGVHFHFQPVSDYRLLTFAICCFDFFFFLRRHSALPTAKCSFRETSHEKHAKLRAVTDSCHWCCPSDLFLQNLMCMNLGFI